MKTPSDYARSIRYAALVTMIAGTSVVQACSSDTILAVPSGTSVTSTTATGPTAPQLRVFGTVTDDEGVPVAGVKVMIYSFPNGGQPSSAVTDNMGFYSTSFVLLSGISAYTEKEGYESAWHPRNNSRTVDGQFDLRIHRKK